MLNRTWTSRIDRVWNVCEAMTCSTIPATTTGEYDVDLFQRGRLEVEVNYMVKLESFEAMAAAQRAVQLGFSG